MTQFQFTVSKDGRFVFRSIWMTDHIMASLRAMRTLTQNGYEVIVSTRLIPVSSETRLTPTDTDEMLRECFGV